MVKDPIVIIGGGRAAASTIDAYREAGGEALVIVLSADEHPPYNRPPLSKAILRGEMEPEEALVHSLGEYEDAAVDMRLRTTVESVDTATETVRLADGTDVSYGTLVIASGTRPILLPVPGSDFPAVHVFRTLEDATGVKADAEAARKALVVGGSFVGSEVAASLRMLGLDVTIVEMGERLVPALASAELSEQVAELYREHGVELLLSEQIEEFLGNGRTLTGARTASGRKIEAFLAVLGVGVEPSLDFLQAGPIEIDNGVVVDDRFRTSVEGIYAVGDVANFVDTASGRRRRIEHWSNADAQGSHLGRHLAGGRKGFAEVPVFFTKMFDLQLQLIGDTNGVDEVVIRGSIGARNLVGFYLRDEHLVAAAVVGQTPDMARELTDLVRARSRLSDRSRLTRRNARPAPAFVS